MKNTQINLNLERYKDKVYACFIGKNIGGTMGGPYECTHDILDVQGFTTAPGTPLPNDDLDLQLVWLHAVEKLGSRAINAATLGEFWLSFITPHWNEYGIGKVNMKRGLMPPLAGDYENTWKNSNGAWIRTEIWACLFPAAPNEAARLATEDAKVNHGSGEGTFAAAFVAAMQAAAFIIPDLRTCIRIGLAEIPENCRMADSIRLALDCYDKGIPAMDARNIIQQRNADIGNGWFEAPSNVAYAVLGLLYGEGDFKKSMLIAINCGDDTDCTAATVGATMGILGGTACIPADWQAYIGDEIVTISINRGDVCRNVPHTCTELCERIVKQTPQALFAQSRHITLVDGADDIPADVAEKLLDACDSHIAEVLPWSVHHDFTFMSVDVALDGAPDIAPGGTREVTLKFTNNWRVFDKCQYNLTLRWWLPEGFTAEGGRQCITLPRMDPHYPDASCGVAFTLKAGETVAAVNRCVLEIVAEGRITPMYIPVVLLG